MSYFVDGVWQASDSGAPWTYTWDTTQVVDGSHSLQAKAYDAAGNVGVSSTVTVQVDNTVPRGYVDIPSNNAPVSGASVHLAGWATDVSRVVSLQFRLDGQLLALNSPYQYGVSRADVCSAYPGDPNCPNVGWQAYFNSRGFADGSHTLSVIATDGVGLSYTASRVFTIANDASAPTAAITTPTGGGARGTVTVTASASDDVGVTKVEFYVDGALKLADTASPWSYAWDTTQVADGSHTLQAKAYDAAGNVGVSSVVTVQVDNTVPRAWVDNPANGALVSGGSVQLSGWATDASRVVSLQFRLDGQPLTLNSPYQYGLNRAGVCATYPGDPNCPYVGWQASFNSQSFADGSHTLSVIATDGVGLACATSRVFTIANGASTPTATITAPAGGGVRGTVTVTASASDDVGVTKVEFYVDAALKLADTASPWSYAWDTTQVADGSHTLQAKAYDGSGNVGLSAVVTVQVDNTVPRAWVDNPSNNTAVSGKSVQLTGWATDASRVVSLQFRLDGQLLALNSPYQYGVSRADVCSVYPGDPSCPNVGWQAYFNSQGFANGSHTLSVIATDGVGLTYAASRTFLIAN